MVGGDGNVLKEGSATAEWPTAVVEVAAAGGRKTRTMTLSPRVAPPAKERAKAQTATP